MIMMDINEENLKLFLKDLRHEDEQEIIALLGKNYQKEFIDICLNLNGETYFLFSDDNKPLALGGVDVANANNLARIWLICSRHIQKNKKDLFRYVISKIEYFKNKYQFLYNYIYKSNYSSLKWLKSCGFLVSDLNNSDYKFFYFNKGVLDFDLRYFTCK